MDKKRVLEQKEFKNKNSLRRFDDQISQQKNIFKNSKNKNDISKEKSFDTFQSKNFENLLLLKNSSEIRKLEYISVCQFCKKPFNAGNNLPLLFNCGHFFCKNCILVNFIDEHKKIVCPEDRYTFKSISELKVLHNLIQNNTILELKEPSINSTKEIEILYCRAHPTQLITHYVENTKESVCIYCAFNKYRVNPKMNIREIPEILREIDDKISKIKEEVTSNIEIIEYHLNYISEQKEIQETNAKEYFDNLLKIITQKKEETIDKIFLNFEENTKFLKNKLEIFKNHHDMINDVKEFSLKSENISSLEMSLYELESKLIESLPEQQLNYTSVLFNVDEPLKITNFIIKYSELKTITDRFELSYNINYGKVMKNRKIDLRNSENSDLSLSLKRSTSFFKNKLQSSSSAGNLLAKSNTIINNCFEKENIYLQKNVGDSLHLNENTPQSFELMNNQICSRGRFNQNGKIEGLMNLIRHRKSNSKNLKNSSK